MIHGRIIEGVRFQPASLDGRKRARHAFVNCMSWKYQARYVLLISVPVSCVAPTTSFGIHFATYLRSSTFHPIHALPSLVQREWWHTSWLLLPCRFVDTLVAPRPSSKNTNHEPSIHRTKNNERKEHRRQAIGFRVDVALRRG